MKETLGERRWQAGCGCPSGVWHGQHSTHEGLHCQLPRHGPQQDGSSFAGMNRIKFSGFGFHPSQRRHCREAHPGAAHSVCASRGGWEGRALSG